MKFKDIKMHELINIDNDFSMLRVPGGIMYTDYCIADQSSVFVPMCSEFELEIPGTEDDN